MKWYFVLNETAHASYIEAAKVAVVTCLENTTLEPNIVYDGGKNDFTAWLESKGVKIHFRSVPFLQELNDRSGQRGLRPSAARGAYLRVVIPELENHDDYVLYTDSDVVFQADPVPSLKKLKPRFIAATVEHSQDDTSYFNSGVMLLNAPVIAGLKEAMYRFFGDNLPNWAGFSPNDQGGLNYFFRGNWDLMDPIYNWKTYWGINPNAMILHYHGNRPPEALLWLRSGIENQKSTHRANLYSNAESRASLLHYSHKYYDYLSGICQNRTRIKRAISRHQDLCIELEIGEDLQFMFILELELVADGRVIEEFPIEMKQLRKDNGKVTVAWSNWDFYADAEVRVRGRDLKYLDEMIFVEDTPPAVETETLVLHRPDQAATAFSGSRSWAKVRDADVISRSWVVPGTNFSVSRRPEGAGAIESEVNVESLIKSTKSAAGPVWRLEGGRIFVTPGLCAVLREEGIVLSDDADLRAVAAALGIVAETPSESMTLGAAIQRRADIVINEPHDVIIADGGGGKWERALSLLLQLGALKSGSGRDGNRLAVVGGGDLERQTLEHLGFGASYFQGPAKDLICFRKGWACFGSGLKTATIANVFDKAIFRARPVFRSDERAVLLLDTGDLTPRHVVHALRLAKGQAIECGALEMRELLARIAGGMIIVVADPSIAPLLAFARRDAAVVHVRSHQHDTGKAIRQHCSLRNLLYAQIDVTELGEPSGDDQVTKDLGALFARVFQRLASSNIGLCDPGLSGATNGR